VEHVDQLISGYALHGLDAADERLVLEHVETCERCRVQLREMEAVAAALAFAAPRLSRRRSCATGCWRRSARRWCQARRRHRRSLAPAGRGGRAPLRWPCQCSGWR
jgi:hypothetical protein